MSLLEINGKDEVQFVHILYMYTMISTGIGTARTSECSMPIVEGFRLSEQ